MQQVKTSSVLSGLIFLSLSAVLILGCQSDKRTFKVRVPGHTDLSGPSYLDPCECDPTGGKTGFEPGIYRLECGGDEQILAQADQQGRLWLMGAGLQLQGSNVCTVVPVKEGQIADRVRFKKDTEGRIDVFVHGELLTTFHYGPDDRIPYLYPVIGPMGVNMTRDYPMADRAYEREHDRQDHPHHQSFWTAWGDLRTGDFSKPGTNYWHSKPGSGRQKVTDVQMREGVVFGELTATIEWQRADGKREMTEQRTYRFYAHKPASGVRVIDVAVHFEFTDGDVMFADTKEGGILSLRLNPEIDEVGGGTMLNAYGQKGSDRCWGAATPWCDYYGPLNGQIVGVAVLDHLQNFRHPTRWHIRGYGLFTANPFGLGHFVGKEHNGSYVWKQGDEVTFNYRVVLHSGDAAQADISDQFYYYANPALPCEANIQH